MVGVIVSISCDFWCRVQWPSGHENGYRIGHNGKFDLLSVVPSSAVIDGSVFTRKPTQPSSAAVEAANGRAHPRSHAHITEVSARSHVSAHVASGSIGPRTDSSEHHYEWHQKVRIGATERDSGKGSDERTTMPRRRNAAEHSLVEAHLGLQVRRGPDWRWGNQDGGDGQVGVIVGLASSYWCHVRWPSGRENGYRIGDSGKFDLQVARGSGIVVRMLSSWLQPAQQGRSIARPWSDGEPSDGRQQRLHSIATSGDSGSKSSAGRVYTGLGAHGHVRSGVQQGPSCGKSDIQFQSAQHVLRHRRGVQADGRHSVCWCIDQYGGILRSP